ncbi:prepilin-type N-terminal cleavage/methylation domain-containing protein [Bacillus cereus]|uniref:prepilin-type N-terminal cleavage/methylation domain-containing protein n=1 Tax=Bacillus cereus TaxID=1396 RepID=UPI00307AF7D2
MLNKFKQSFKNQKGFTLVEILVVIVIIGILFVLLLPRLDFANDKARQSGVKTDLRAFQTAAEGYLKETAGQNISQSGLNTYLDKALQNPTASTTVISTAVVAGDSSEKDPWGTAYKIEMKKPSTTTAQVIIKSAGKKANIAAPEYFGATYYKDGVVESCTAKFGGSQDILLQSIVIATGPTNGDPNNKCGGDVS